MINYKEILARIAHENIDHRHPDIDGEELRQNWFTIVPGWARRPPFYVVDRYGRPRLVCGRYADVREIQMDKGERFTVAVPADSGFEQFDFFMGLPNVAQSDLEDHDRMRAVLAKPFSRASFAAFEPRMKVIIAEMLDAVREKSRNTGEIELMSDFCSHLVARIILKEMLGFETAQLGAFYQMNEALSSLQDVKPGAGFPALYTQNFEVAKNAVSELINLRKANPGDDMVSAMLSAGEGKNRLTEEELIGNVFAIAAGGLTTTSVSLGMAIYNLCRHPDQLAALRANLSLIPSALEECLRYQGPGYINFLRFAVTDTEVGDVPVCKGTPIAVSAQAANFDPDKFDDPMRFDIFRKPAGILTFGGGPHLCIAFQIARAIMRISLEDMIPRFPRLRLADSNFRPVYHGMQGEIAPKSIPVRVD